MTASKKKNDDLPNKHKPQEEAQTESGVQRKIGGQKEIGGREGPEPTRYGDWEKKGIISDF